MRPKARGIATTPAGLPAPEAAQRLAAHGPNELKEAKPTSLLSIAWKKGWKISTRWGSLPP